MNRREMIAGLAGTGAWPLAARAQHDSGVHRIGYLALTSGSFHKPYGDAFRRGLQELGYIEGKNLEIEARYADGDTDRLPGLVAELVGLNERCLLLTQPGLRSRSARHQRFQS